MSRSHQLAWAAGFIDGDGFITIQNRKTKYKDKIYTGTYLRVGACQAHLTPLEKLQDIFGGSIRPKNCGPNPHGYNRKQQWVWTLSTDQAKEALEQLLPYLVHKKEVALLGIAFQNTMTKDKQGVPPEVVTLRLDFQNEIAHLNSLS
jgi:hypothetical protein